MRLYRIVHKKYSESLHATGIAGRWNSEGRKVIYTAESIPLAFMENMVRRKGLGFNDQFRVMIIDVPDKASIKTVDAKKLPAGWRSNSNYAMCQSIGNDWYDKQQTLLLKVPSAVLPTNYNYVLNTQHPDYKSVKLVGTTSIIPDERIEELLKGR